MLPSTTFLHSNKLLTSLPRECQAVITAYLDFVELRAGQVLSQYGQKLKHIYFPTTAALSIRSLLENGGEIDVAEVGMDGTNGALAAIGFLASPYSHRVQIAGHAYRMDVRYFTLMVENNLDFRRACLLYLNYMYTQTAQNTVCVKHHTVHARVCRWLLTHADMVGGNIVIATQQEIGDSLGSRREGITEVMANLVDNEVVRHTRGAVEIVDLQAVRNQACVCYPLLKTAINQTFPSQYRERDTVLT
jgi:CRP-like cAMP-binding protein